MVALRWVADQLSAQAILAVILWPCLRLRASIRERAWSQW